MMFIGNTVKDIIYKRVKSGSGVNKGNKEKLKPLSQSYIEYRKKNKPQGKFASPTRSNLTNTGQMLDNFEISVEGLTTLVTIASNGRTDSKLTNAMVAEFVSKERPFMDLSQSEMRLLISLISKEIKKRLT